MKRLVGILLVSIISVFVTLPATAQSSDDSLGLAIRPAIFDISADKGTTASIEITIENLSAGAVGIEIGADSLLPNDAAIDQDKLKDSDASTWMLDKGQKIVLEESEIKQIPIQFIVPDEASPGTHHALVTFTTTNPADINGSGTVVTPVVNSLALINVSGEITEELSIGDLDLPLFIFGQDHELKFEIANTGNVHALPVGTVRLYDRSNKLVESIAVPPQLILPNTIKEYVAEWSSSGRIGKHRIEIEITYGSPAKYTSIDSGTIYLMPDASGMLFAGSLIIILILVLLYIFKGPLRRLRRNIKSNRHRYRIKSRKKTEDHNLPEEMARISMSSAKLDELLSSSFNRTNRNPRHQKTPQKTKKRRRIVQ